MTARNHLEFRQAIEDQLAERAEDLLRERARKLGMSPSTLLNQIVREDPPKPRAKDDPDGPDSDAIVALLVKRLAERD